MADETGLSPTQFAAAQFYVARLASEAAGGDFSVDDLGWEWTPFENIPCMMTDEGTMLRPADFIRAGLILLWSVINEIADEYRVPADIVQAIGVHLASNRPEET